MDPNENLKELRALILAYYKADADGLSLADMEDGAGIDFDRLITLISALDDWMTAGGFLPAPWMQHREPPEPNPILPLRHRGSKGGGLTLI